jgi:hypothetical protein
VGEAEHFWQKRALFESLGVEIPHRDRDFYPFEKVLGLQEVEA